jgi:recombination protein RecA
MPSASTIRLQIESALAQRIPSALTPAPRMIRPVAATGIEPLDDLLQGGLPIGAMTEFVGPECSGRTSLALSFVARMTQSGKACAWIDVSDTFDPVSAASVGLNLANLLWIRCGVQPQTGKRITRNFRLPEKYLAPPPAKKGMHGGGFGPHPRTEAKDLSKSFGSLLHPETIAPRCAEPQRRAITQPEKFAAMQPQASASALRPARPSKPWSRIEQALRSADLLLQIGGFSALVLDMGSLAPEFVSRVPLATWHRYRLAGERTQSSIVLLTQHACAKSSAELLLRFDPATPIAGEATIFTGIQTHVVVERQRFTQTPNNIVSIRKPSRSANTASWQSRTSWAGAR